MVSEIFLEIIPCGLHILKHCIVRENTLDLTLNVPCISESYIEIKNKLIFFFTLVLPQKAL